MFTMKYLDGTPVDPEYLNAVSQLVRAACVAEERISLDELEAAAAAQPPADACASSSVAA